MANSDQIDKCIAALAVVYPHHFKQNGINVEAARAIYHRILADVNDSLLEAATMQWLSTAHPFHPSPGELRDLALRMMTRNEPSADEAWIEVIEAMRKVGSYSVPAWSNERIARTVSAFGWKDLCATDNSQLGTVRAQFMRIYEAQTTRLHDDRLMLPETRQRVEALIGQSTKRLEQPR